MVLAGNMTFLEEVSIETPHGVRLRDCIQCGSCGGSCPNGAEMDHTPRHLFAMIQAGLREEVLSANTMWKCVSCYLCTSRCPQDIHITDMMYVLKRMAIREGYARSEDAPALARTFTNFVERYGRSFEFGIASRYLMLRKPITAMRMGGLAFSMLRRGRMSLKPTRIDGVEQLQAIVKKAKEIGVIS